MQDTPKANRLHIAIFGRRNAGKSSLINALTRQEIALVSEVPGTTTDPVFKAMEILPIGPCMIIDTAGIDDEGQLGELRIKKTREVLNQTDLALLVIDPALGISEFEKELKQAIRSRKIALIGVLNKTDQGQVDKKSLEKQLGLSLVAVSSRSGEGIEFLKERIIERAPAHFEEAHIVGDLIEPGDILVFAEAGKIFHVGIALSENSFIHAASDGPRKGVIISGLHESYWSQRLSGIRKIEY